MDCKYTNFVINSITSIDNFFNDSIDKRIEKHNVQYITIGHIHFECGFEGIIGCNQSGRDYWS